MEKLIVLQPCPISGKCIAEFKLERKISIGLVCSFLQKNVEVSDLRYSDEIGIAKFDFKEKRVRLDSNGKISISKINNLKEAGIFIDKIKSLIQKAL